MNNFERDFIELTKRAICKEYAADDRFNGTDWEAVYELTESCGFCAVLYDAVKNQSSIPEDIRKKWDANKFAVFVRQASHFHLTTDIVSDIEAEGIDYAVFKGAALALYYPVPEHRTSADTDILVAEKDKAKVAALLEKRGYELNELKTKEKVLVYRNSKSKHCIELHTSVFEDYVGGKIELLKGAGLDSTEHRINVGIKGKSIRTFGISQHLLYQMFHTIKHFVLEGASVKFFTDITLFVNANIDSIDRDYFWKWLRKCNYEEFTKNFLEICVSYFGMNPEFIEGHRATVETAVLEEILMDFIYQGDEDRLRRRPWQIAESMEHFLVGQDGSGSSKEKPTRLEFMFPKPGMLDARYEYARKCHLLLPIAWMHRCLKHIHWVLFIKKKENEECSERLNYRVKLLRDSGLDDEE